jgi:hypothetical protein
MTDRLVPELRSQLLIGLAQVFELDGSAPAIWSLNLNGTDALLAPLVTANVDTCGCHGE